MWKVGRQVGFTGVIAAMLAMVPADVHAQKKKKKDDTPQYPARRRRAGRSSRLNPANR
jgi:hypothetical protein